METSPAPGVAVSFPHLLESAVRTIASIASGLGATLVISQYDMRRKDTSYHSAMLDEVASIRYKLESLRNRIVLEFGKEDGEPSFHLDEIYRLQKTGSGSSSGSYMCAKAYRELRDIVVSLGSMG